MAGKQRNTKSKPLSKKAKIILGTGAGLLTAGVALGSHPTLGRRLLSAAGMSSERANAYGNITKAITRPITGQ